MDKIYEDFTTKLLPQIQAGLVISKDYFTDLFGRYIKYLIVADSMWLVIAAIIAGTGIIFAVQGFKLLKKNIGKSWAEEDARAFPFSFIGPVVAVLGLCMFIYYAECLIKDIYIPEVRIYQTLKYFNR